MEMETLELRFFLKSVTSKSQHTPALKTECLCHLQMLPVLIAV